MGAEECEDDLCFALWSDHGDVRNITRGFCGSRESDDLYSFAIIRQAGAVEIGFHFSFRGNVSDRGAKISRRNGKPRS